MEREWSVENKMNDTEQRIMSMAEDDYIMRLSEVMRKTGLSRSTVYNLVAAKEFPRQINLSQRSVGWLASEVTAWLNQRIQHRETSGTRVAS